MSPTAPSFPSCRKRRGRKGALGYGRCFLHLNLGRKQCFSLTFHTRLTLRAFWYAPPDTGGIRFVTSCRRISAINRRCRPDLLVCTFLRGGFIDLHAPRLPLLRGAGAERLRGEPRRSGPMAPLLGELSPKVTERSSQICCDLSVSAPPSHLPWKGRLWDCALQGFSYEGKAGAAEN